jgi:hypothetical protein
MSFTYQAHANPDRIEVIEEGTWVATFTIHCYTVTLTGPTRTFSETFKKGGTTHNMSVTHSKWVRAAPVPLTRQSTNAGSPARLPQMRPARRMRSLSLCNT